MDQIATLSAAWLDPHRELARREAGDVLVMNWELPPWEELEAAGSRLGAIVASEDYRLYRLRHGRLGETAAAARCESAAEPRQERVD